MAYRSANVPTRSEKETQVARVLSSKTFANKPTLARLLKRLAESHYKRKPVDEYTLGIELFARQKDWITQDDTIVRENLRRLRKLLDEYYVRYGSDDGILIAVHAYRISFTYSHQTAADQQYRLGCRILSKGDPILAESCFMAAIKDKPDYALAYVGRANCRLTLCILLGSEVYVDSAEEFASTACKLNAKLWQAHVVVGAIFSFRRQWSKALESFKRALEINRPQAEQSPWYLMSLIANGLNRYAVRIAKTRLVADAANSSAYTMYSSCLYLSGWHMEAANVLMRSEAIERPDSFALTCAACVNLALNRGKEALELIGKTDETWRSFPIMEGLFVLALGLANEKRRAQAEFAKLEGRPQNSLAMAMPQMGVGRRQKAVATLKQACKDFEPLMILVHTLPILNPLLRLRSFCAVRNDYRPLGKRH